MRGRRRSFERFDGPHDPRLTSLMVVSDAGIGAGPGPSPSSTFSLWVEKGGSDSAGDGSDDAPYLTITKAITVAKTLALGGPTFQECAIYVGPGEFTENLVVPPWLNIVSLAPFSAILNGNVTLDSPTWVADRSGFAGTILTGIYMLGSITLDFTGFALGDAFGLHGCIVGDVTVTGDAVGGASVDSHEVYFSGVISATGCSDASGGFNTFNCYFADGEIHVVASATLDSTWHSIGDSTSPEQPVAITLDATAGQPAVGFAMSALANGGTLTLNGAGASYTACLQAVPKLITLLNGAPPPVLMSFANGLGYTPGVPGNWAGAPPTTVQEALDRIAAKTPGA